MTDQRTALIDADILLHRATSVATTSVEFDGVCTHQMDLDHAKNVFRNQLREIREEVRADKVVLCYSDLDREANWRRQVLASYKHGRASIRPAGYQQLAAWAREIRTETIRTKWLPTLEADDVLGILATGKGIGGTKIVCTVDKDLRTVPGRLYDWLKDEKVIIAPEEADRNHLFQTLVGDPTDGYKGCPGVGKVNAARILDRPIEECWDEIVKAFEKAGLGEPEALAQARVARILRAGEYTKSEGVRLWCPYQLTEEVI